MTKTSTDTGRLPHGTNVLVKAFTAAIDNLPARSQKLAAAAALSKLKDIVKAIPTWQDPKVSAATKSAAATKKGGTKKAPPKKGSSRSIAAKGVKRGRLSRTSSSIAPTNSVSAPTQVDQAG